MKTLFNSIFVKRLSLVALLGVLLCGSSLVQGQVYYIVQQLLSEHFQRSERVSYQRIAVTERLRQRLSHDLGVKPPKGEYTVYVASSGDKVDGYALFDEERGQHEMIGFVTFFDAQGKVTRVEVTAFREPHGDGVRAGRFRKQFVGRNARSGFQPDSDIDAVSGATISSRSLCKGVQRATALIDAAVLQDPALASRL